MISSLVSWAEVFLQLVIDLLLHPLVVVLATALGEAQTDRLADVGGTEVGGEDQHGVLEVDCATLTVGETAILEHLQQAVVDLLVRLLDLVEQHHRERLAPHLLGQLAAFLVTDVSRRGAEQSRRGESVVELAHVDLDERVVVTEQEVGQRLGQLGLTDTGRTGEDERTGRALRVLQPGTGTTDGLRHGTHRVLLPDDPLVQLIFHPQQPGGLGLGELEHRDTGPVAEHLSDLVVIHLSDHIEVA
jgi:hypothetical protein